MTKNTNWDLSHKLWMAADALFGVMLMLSAFTKPLFSLLPTTVFILGLICIVTVLVSKRDTDKKSATRFLITIQVSGWVGILASVYDFFGIAVLVGVIIYFIMRSRKHA